MGPKIEFSTTPMFGLYADTDFLYEHVSRLKEMSKPSAGDQNMDLWKGLVLGNRGYGETPLAAAVYSPYLLGRELDLNNWDDCSQLYYSFFEMYTTDYQSNSKEIYDDFNRDHHYCCPWGLNELLETWESSKQHKNITNHIKETHEVAVRKKI